MQGQYWQRHPTQVAFLRAFLAGEWVTRSFGWFYMMVSRFAGPVMTIAVGYLILYAIDSHHGLSTVVSHPTVWDSIAQVASGIINVTPELVFPGTVVLSIQALLRRSWLHGALYATASLMFAVLTILLLQAYMTGGLTDNFLSNMLLWRAVSALSYTVVAEVCSHHDGVHSPDAGVHSQGVQSQLDDLVHQVHNLTSALHEVHAQVQQALSQGTLHPHEVHPAAPQEQTVHPPLPEQHAVHTYPSQGAVHPPESAPTSETAPLETTPLETAPLLTQRAPSNSAPQVHEVHPRGEGGKGAQVQQFLSKQMAQGNTPTLDEIMEACQCSKHTAIRYRRAMLGDTPQEESNTLPPVLVLADRRGK